MGKYEADDESIQCAGRIATIKGCRDILLGMPATEQGQLFGPEIAPGAGVNIPYTIKSCKLFYRYNLRPLTEACKRTSHAL